MAIGCLPFCRPPAASSDCRNGYSVMDDMPVKSGRYEAAGGATQAIPFQIRKYQPRNFHRHTGQVPDAASYGSYQQ